MKTDEAIKVDCNRYHNGHCSTRACLIRGGWNQGDDYDKSLANATCDAHEIITLRDRIKIAIEALEECRRFCNEFDYEPTYNDIENIDKALAKIRS